MKNIFSQKGFSAMRVMQVLALAAVVVLGVVGSIYLVLRIMDFGPSMSVVDDELETVDSGMDLDGTDVVVDDEDDDKLKSETPDEPEDKDDEKGKDVSLKLIDSDEDGVSDYDEIYLYNSDPKSSDTDGDGYTDGEEVKSGHSPTIPASNLEVLEPENERLEIQQTRFEIRGTNTNNVTKIRVVYANEDAGLSDDYYLTKFMSGDTNWAYVADVRYKNLAYGTNEYQIMVYQEDELLKEEKRELEVTVMPGKEETVSVEWEDELGEPMDMSCLHADYCFLVGKVTSGVYTGYDLYLSEQVGMGVSFDHFVRRTGEDIKGGEEKIVFREHDIRIADLEDLPERIQLPDTDYYLTIGYSGAIFKKSEDMVELFEHDVLGSVYQKGNCIVAELPDHREIAYYLEVPFYNEQMELEVTFEDGTKNEDTYVSSTRRGCGYSCSRMAFVKEEDLSPVQRLEVAGITSNGEELYEFKDTNDGFLWSVYSDKSTLAYYDDGRLEESKYTYNEFLVSHPVLYWKDPLGRWIRFKNRKYDVMAEMCKPVVYLYPEKTTDIRVRVAPNGGFTFTEPEYKNGWYVTADPNGKIVERGTKKEYEYLFWEGIGLNYRGGDEGFVVERVKLARFFDEKLVILGLNKKEIADFKEYWVDRLSEQDYYLITFIPQSLFDQVAPLKIDPKPDSIIRVMMHAKGLDYPMSVKEQKLVTPKRDRFTVVEWGGAVVR